MKRNVLIFFITGVVYLLQMLLLNVITHMSITLVGSTSLWFILIGGLWGVVLSLFNDNNKIRMKLNVFSQVTIGFTIVLLFQYIVQSIGIFPIDVFFVSKNEIWLSVIIYFTIPFLYWFYDMLNFVLYNKGTPYLLKNVYLNLFIFWKKTLLQGEIK